MRAAHRGNAGRMARGCEPVVHGGANTPALDGRLAGTVMAGDEEYQALTAADRLLEPAVDRPPRTVKVQTMEIDGAVGLDRAAAKPAVPAAVEGRSKPWLGSCNRDCRRSPNDARVERRWQRFRSFFSILCFNLGTRQRLDRGCHSGPKLSLVRAERAHARRCPWESGSAPRPRPTCRPRSQPLQGPRPRRCRSGSAP